MKIIGYIHPYVIDRLESAGGIVGKCAFDYRISHDKNDIQTVPIYVDDEDEQKSGSAAKSSRLE